MTKRFSPIAGVAKFAGLPPLAKLALVFVAAGFCLFCLQCFSFLLPDGRIRQNAEESLYRNTFFSIEPREPKAAH